MRCSVTYSSGRAALVLILVLASASGVAATVAVETVQPLVAQMASDQPAQRAAAEKALLAIGPEAIAPLLQIVKGGNLADVTTIRELLPKYGPGAIEALYEAGRRDFGGTGDQVMWNAATNAVARMGDSAEPIVMDWFLHENPYGSDFTFVVSVLAAPTIQFPRRETSADCNSDSSELPEPSRLSRGRCALGGLQEWDGPDDEGRRGSRARETARQEGRRAVSGSTRGAQLRHTRVCRGFERLYEPRFRSVLAKVERSDREVGVRERAATALISTKDPIAVRLGWRYRPMSIDPAAEFQVFLAYAILLAGTFAIVLLVAVGCVWLGSRLSGVGRFLAIATQVMLRAAAGFAWGGLLKRLTESVELAIPMAVIPLAAVATLGITFAMRLGSTIQRLAWTALGFSGFYCAYAVGWLWLWGHFGL